MKASVLKTERHVMASWVRIPPHPPSCYAARRCTLIMRARTFVPLERNALSGSWRTSAPISSSQARSSAASLRLFRCSTSRLVRSIRTVVHRSTVRAPPKVAGPYQDPTAADLVAALPARAAPVLDVHRRVEVGRFRCARRRRCADPRQVGACHAVHRASFPDALRPRARSIRLAQTSM